MQYFVDWVSQQYGPDILDDIRMNGGRKFPYGLFVGFVRSHPTLARRCKMTEPIQFKNLSRNSAYKRVYSSYMRMLPPFLKKCSTVVEARTDLAVPDSRHPEDPRLKFRYKLRRTGGQYIDKHDRTIREWLRRRQRGGGRKRACSEIRHGLARWYNSKRRSGDTKTLCRFPRKVLLVKARHSEF